MSFDKIFDLTAGVYFSFFIIYIFIFYIFLIIWSVGIGCIQARCYPVLGLCSRNIRGDAAELVVQRIGTTIRYMIGARGVTNKTKAPRHYFNALIDTNAT